MKLHHVLSVAIGLCTTTACEELDNLLGGPPGDEEGGSEEGWSDEPTGVPGEPVDMDGDEGTSETDGDATGQAPPPDVCGPMPDVLWPEDHELFVDLCREAGEADDCLEGADGAVFGTIFDLGDHGAFDGRIVSRQYRGHLNGGWVQEACEDQHGWFDGTVTCGTEEFGWTWGSWESEGEGWGSFHGSIGYWSPDGVLHDGDISVEGRWVADDGQHFFVGRVDWHE